MNYTTLYILIFIVLITILNSGVEQNSAFATSNTIPKSGDITKLDKTNGTIDFFHSSDKGDFKISIPISKLLFNITTITNTDGSNTFQVALDSKLSKLYEEIGNFKNRKNIVFVYPAFTQAAYDKNGFYYYYAKSCNTKCLTVDIPKGPKLSYHTSQTAVIIFNLLNYSSITDIALDKNPSILKKYDKVILLHNEYVTKKEFDAITKHPNVVYLFPNALYAEVKTDYTKNTMTLVRGHGYPSTDISNGFGWKFDNSKLEYDYDCKNWKFVKNGNGKMLKCYPYYRLLYDSALLKEIVK
ncbi:MAG: hypothetical protein HYZ56_00835 [Nitrosopumilales archaeon]|nr:hypothetical protein [Nitrosopumilales archaeon]